jgi:hypothetical protein
MQIKMWFRSLRSVAFVMLCVPMSLAIADQGFAKTKKSAAGKKERKSKKEGEEGGGGGYSAPYGMAGCGLGSLVFHNDTMGQQITASTLNGTGFQTSAISCTHSSNCKAEREEAAREEQKVFVAANLRALEVDVSTGGGNYTHAFAEVLGCANDGVYDRFLEVSRSNYSSIFTSSDPSEVYENYLHVLRAEGKLATQCERVYLST